MLKKDAFILMLCITTILLLLITPLNQKIKDIGNLITGFGPIAKPGDGSGRGGDEGDGSGSDATPTTELEDSVIAPESAPTLDTETVKKSPTTDEIIEEAKETSAQLKSPDVETIINALKLSETEEIIVQELASDYVKSVSEQTAYTKSEEKETETPKEVRLSIPEQKTDLILGVKDNIYPFININIKA